MLLNVRGKGKKWEIMAIINKQQQQNEPTYLIFRCCEGTSILTIIQYWYC
jgi:hypothetical protein